MNIIDSCRAHLLVASLVLVITSMGSNASAQTPPSDADISQWVVNALREDPRVRFASIQVATQQGNVNLTGSVFSLAERQYARLIALKIQGVRKVSNRLTVKTPERASADIQNEVRQRLLQSSLLNIHELQVSADDQRVIIRGVVNSLTKLEMATLIASEVRGVKEVENQILVRLTSRRSDEEISKDLEDAMGRDVYLNTLPIDISVHNAAVTLTGSVGNAYQRERATQEARRVANVVRIDNQLDVQWQRERGVKNATPNTSDAELQAAVQDELRQDIRIDDSSITVTADTGHVVLRGSVNTYAEKQIASEASMSVAGTLWASNLLTVQPKYRDSIEIRQDITAALQSDYLLGSQRIDVHVVDGAVTLAGIVNSANEKVHAAEVAGRISGVRNVNNVLGVTWTPKYRDAALDARVRDRLLANYETRWVANQIAVRTDGGKVSLFGSVQTLAQRREAGRIAQLVDGIWAVDNQLTVRGVNYQWEDWHSDTPSMYFDAYPEYQMKFLERRY